MEVAHWRVAGRRSPVADRGVSEPPIAVAGDRQWLGRVAGSPTAGWSGRPGCRVVGSGYYDTAWVARTANQRIAGCRVRGVVGSPDPRIPGSRGCGIAGLPDHGAPGWIRIAESQITGHRSGAADHASRTTGHGWQSLTRSRGLTRLACGQLPCGWRTSSSGMFRVDLGERLRGALRPMFHVKPSLDQPSMARGREVSRFRHGVWCGRLFR